uniref:Serum amyloid A protein n=1 Tax=Bos indicus x Bos taurus TaxID=30522 RepID=A0A4W2BTW0_BOBOX
MTCKDFPRAPVQLFSSRPTSQGWLSINIATTPQQAGTSRSDPLGISTMKLFTGLILCSLVLGVHSQWMSFFGEAYEGAKDMWRAYSDMREANYKDADKYFHARGNYDAARRGPGGAWAAKVISYAREPFEYVAFKEKVFSSACAALLHGCFLAQSAIAPGKQLLLKSGQSLAASALIKSVRCLDTLKKQVGRYMAFSEVARSSSELPRQQNNSIFDRL